MPFAFHSTWIKLLLLYRHYQYWKMETDLDLPTLIARKDHLNVLRYIRVHELREPELVVQHGKALLGGEEQQLKGKMVGGGGADDNLARLAALEQICLAALDVANKDDSSGAELLAKTCLDRLRDAGIEKEAVRFRRLVARCLEAAEDYNGAELIYQDLLKDNPANLAALKRLYCISRAKATTYEGQQEACEAMSHYLEFNHADTGAWYELAQLRLEMADFKAAAFCLEEVLLGMPADSDMHTQLAECYSTLAANSSTTGNDSLSDLEYCMSARKHFAQALELEPSNRRALFGLVCASNDYLVAAANTSTSKKKQQSDASITKDHEQLVAKELVKYGAEKVIDSYNKGSSSMLAAVKSLMTEYTEGL